jgi:putative glycosyltransferase (TIGR04372 family)
MKSKIYLFAQSLIIIILVGRKLLLSIHKISRADRIFINSQGFGHSVHDTLAYIEFYGNNCLVLSIGTEFGQKPGTERNKFFEAIFEENIITLLLPTVFTKKETWRYSHPLVKRMLIMLCIIINKKEYIIEENNRTVIRAFLPKIINTKFDIDLLSANRLLDNIYGTFLNQGNLRSAESVILTLIKSYELDPKLLLRFANNRQINYVNDNLHTDNYACLSVRRGAADYHSTSDYYFDAVNLAFEKGIKTYLVGDKYYFFEKANERNFVIKEKVLNYEINQNDSKFLDIFAIYNCLFAYGDQSGAWSLVNAFSKPGLLINTTPISYLNYNTESLPKKWVDSITGEEVLDEGLIFNELFHRNNCYDNVELNMKLIQSSNEENFISDVFDRYIETKTYLLKQKMSEKILTTYHKEFFQLAVNSNYSTEYSNKINGWRHN